MDTLELMRLHLDIFAKKNDGYDRNELAVRICTPGLVRHKAGRAHGEETMYLTKIPESAIYNFISLLFLINK